MTDSPLTNHGVLQANRLGSHLAASKVSRIFSSDLDRAVKTAEAVCTAQDHGIALQVIKLELLREQDFGYYEKKQFHERPKHTNKPGSGSHSEAYRTRPGFKDVESKESMKGRMETFVNEHLMHLLDNSDKRPNDHAIVIVAHGIILGHLWRVILGQFDRKNVSTGPDVPNPERGLQHLGGWSNTGYLDLDIKPMNQVVAPAKVGLVSSVLGQQSNAEPSVELSKDNAGHSQTPSFGDELSIQSIVKLPNHDCGNIKTTMSLVIKSVNNQDHLQGLKKTRGGLGSLKHDSSQRTMDSFFKKRRLE